MQDVQDVFEHIIKKYKTFKINLNIQIYIKEIQKRVMFIIKSGNYLEILHLKLWNYLEQSQEKDKQRKKMLKTFLN